MAIVVKKIARSVRLQVPGVGKKKQSSLLPRYNQKTPPCQASCPSAEDIRGYLTTLAQADEYGRSAFSATELAWHTLTDKNPIPAIMGRVCPHPCETGCNRNQKDQPVNINRVELALGDFGITNQLALKKLTEQSTGKKIAVVGSGPAGISAAYQLARRGHSVTIYEERSEAGGMLRWGIPAYRLPRNVIEAEYGKIKALGVEIKLNVKVGRDIALADLEANYDAVYFAIGAQQGRTLPLEGASAPNANTGVGFLADHNLGRVTALTGQVLVIGGGDVAYDVARTSRRLGGKVVMVCRETADLMPATKDEIHHGSEEGITLHPGYTPKRLILEGGRVKAVEFLQVQMGEKDENGWPKVTEIPGTEMQIPCDHVITAISQSPDWTGLEGMKNQRGWLTAEGKFGRLKADSKVWAGGDITRGLGLVTQAIGDGRMAALEIDAVLAGKEFAPAAPAALVSYKTMHLGFYPEAKRNEVKELAPEERLKNFAGYLEGFDPQSLLNEASRCMSCGACFDCDTCWSYCGDGAITKMPKGKHYEFILEKCIGCSKCADQCPCTMIDMV